MSAVTPVTARARGVVLVLVLVFVGLSACGAAPPMPTASEFPGDTSQLDAGPSPVTAGVEMWRKRFDDVAAEEDRTIYDPASRSSDSWDHYNLAFGLDGFVAMYRASSDRRYLEVALRYAENLVASARPSSELGPEAVGDGYRGWTSARIDVSGTEVPLFESFVWRYVVGMLRVIRSDASLWRDVDLRARYERILAFAEHDVVEKWTSRSPDNIYRENTHMTSHWASIALDLSLLTTSQERRQDYLAIVHSVDRDLPNRTSSLREQFVPHPDDGRAWFWNDVWGSSARPGQDVAHGNGVIAYLVTAHELGSEWTTRDLAGMRVLLREKIWRPDGTYAYYVSGEDAEGNGWISDGFMKLGRFDPRIQSRLETYTGATPDNRGGEVQFLGNGALNARFLTSPASVPASSPPTPSS